MGAKRLTGGRNILNWDKSSRRRGRNVLKMGTKRLGGRNVYGAKCPGALKNDVNRFGHQNDIAIPKNSDTYFDLCKKYKQLVQRKKRTHIKKCKQELQCLTTENPNNYWGFLKNLKRKSTQDEVDIDLSDFYFCFFETEHTATGTNR